MVEPMGLIQTPSFHSPMPTSAETICSPVDCHKNAPFLPAQEELFDAMRLKTDTFVGQPQSSLVPRGWWRDRVDR